MLSRGGGDRKELHRRISVKMDNDRKCKRKIEKIAKKSAFSTFSFLFIFKNYNYIYKYMKFFSPFLSSP